MMAPFLLKILYYKIWHQPESKKSVSSTQIYPANRSFILSRTINWNELTISVVNSSTERAYLPQKVFLLRVIRLEIEEETRELRDKLEPLMSLQVGEKQFIRILVKRCRRSLTKQLFYIVPDYQI